VAVFRIKSLNQNRQWRFSTI